MTTKMLVVGTGRSGTSMVAGLLRLYGFDFANTPKSASSSHPTGYWEHPELVAINGDILRAFGKRVSWIAVPRLPDGWEDDVRLEPLYARARELRPEVLKDPRASGLLPFWRKAFDVRLLVVCRDREATIAAAMRRSRLATRARAERFYDSYTEALDRESAGMRSCFVRYEDFFVRHPSDLLDEVAGALGYDRREHDRDALLEFVRPDLKHH